MNLGAKQLVALLKDVAGSPGPQPGLRVEGQTQPWMLRPVSSHRALLRPRDVHSLALWRNKFRRSFLTEITATEASTASWLADIIGPDENRILFMIDDPSGEAVGSAGIGFIDWTTGYGEADAILRGGCAPKGLMTSALRTLFDWGRGQLALTQIGVRVRSDNSALEFYRKFGFVETRRVPLAMRREADKVVWFEQPDLVEPALSLVYHLLP